MNKHSSHRKEKRLGSEKDENFPRYLFIKMQIDLRPKQIKVFA